MSPRPRVGVYPSWRASPRLYSPASRTPRPAPRFFSRTPLPAFSLVEMMIAIMILGLGMVMAATVFPVSLDMTKGTLQMNISQTAAEVAAATLAIRVPHENDSLMPTFTRAPSVALPDMYARELQYPVNTGETWIDTDKLLANLDATDSLILPYALSSSLTADQLLRTRQYTEQTFWDAEVSTATVLSAYVIAAQNMQVGLSVVAEVPPMLYPGSQSVPRISIADRVYPPVDRYLIDGTERPLENVDPNDLGVLDEIAARRYCWTALHYKDLHDLTGSGYYCQIVVLYRSNLDGRYIRQRPDTYPTLPLSDPLPVPQPEETGANDTLFPQAWSVIVHMNGPAGVVSCTSNVAALLPAGSYIISADATLYSVPGAFTKILKNNWDGTATLEPGDPTAWPTWPTLQIEPGEFSINDFMRVWVFPPATQSTPPGIQGSPSTYRIMDDVPNGKLSNVQFETVSPVIDVVPKKVNAG